jgi:integrase
MKNDPTEEKIHILRERLRGHHLEAMITLAMVTGMRRDELLRVRWSHVDLQLREIRVFNSKTQSGPRLIRIPEENAQMLRQHHLHQREQHAEADTTRPHLDLVFPDDAGGLLSAQGFLKQWDACFEQVGLPRLRFHDLRALMGQRHHGQLRIP